MDGRVTYILFCQRDALIADESETTVSVQLHMVTSSMIVVWSSRLYVFVMMDGGLLC